MSDAVEPVREADHHRGAGDPASPVESAMSVTTARVPTAYASRYLQQLCKHWGHKFEVSCDALNGEIRLPGAILTLEAQEGFLETTLTGDDRAALERMRGVVAEHLDRFAFREAPLPFVWAVE